MSVESVELPVPLDDVVHVERVDVVNTVNTENLKIVLAWIVDQLSRVPSRDDVDVLKNALIDVQNSERELGEKIGAVEQRQNELVTGLESQESILKDATEATAETTVKVDGLSSQLQALGSNVETIAANVDALGSEVEALENATNGVREAVEQDKRELEDIRNKLSMPPPEPLKPPEVALVKEPEGGSTSDKEFDPMEIERHMAEIEKKVTALSEEMSSSAPIDLGRRVSVIEDELQKSRTASQEEAYVAENEVVKPKFDKSKLFSRLEGMEDKLDSLSRKMQDFCEMHALMALGDAQSPALLEDFDSSEDADSPGILDTQEDNQDGVEVGAEWDKDGNVVGEVCGSGQGEAVAGDSGEAVVGHLGEAVVGDLGEAEGSGADGNGTVTSHVSFSVPDPSAKSHRHGQGLVKAVRDCEWKLKSLGSLVAGLKKRMDGKVDTEDVERVRKQVIHLTAALGVYSDRRQTSQASGKGSSSGHGSARSSVREASAATPTEMDSPDGESRGEAQPSTSGGGDVIETVEKSHEVGEEGTGGIGLPGMGGDSEIGPPADMGQQAAPHPIFAHGSEVANLIAETAMNLAPQNLREFKDDEPQMSTMVRALIDMKADKGLVEQLRRKLDKIMAEIKKISDAPRPDPIPTPIQEVSNDASLQQLQDLKSGLHLVASAANVLAVGHPSFPDPWSDEPDITGQIVTQKEEASTRGEEGLRPESAIERLCSDARSALLRLDNLMKAGAIHHKMDNFDPDTLNKLSYRMASIESAFRGTVPTKVGGADSDRVLKRLMHDVRDLKFRLQAMNNNSLTKVPFGDYAMLSTKPMLGYKCMACDRPLEKLEQAPGPFIPHNMLLNQGRQSPDSRSDCGSGKKSAPGTPHNERTESDKRGGQSKLGESYGRPAAAMSTQDVGPQLPKGGWKGQEKPYRARGAMSQETHLPSIGPSRQRTPLP